MTQPTQLLQQAQPQVEIFRPNLFESSANIFIALFCGALISLVYRIVRRKTAHPLAFANSLVLLSLITAIVTLVIGNNLARAFGLVGTMSIIRFRTAVRDVEDIVFIFFSLTMGMAAGVGLNAIALAGTILICLTILLLHAFGDNEPPESPKGFLQITTLGPENRKKQMAAVLKKYARRPRLLSERKIEDPVCVELFYRLSVRNSLPIQNLISDVQALEYVSNVHWIAEENQNAN